MDYAILIAELTDDPLGRDYSVGMSDEQVAADLNTVYRERNKESMTGSEVLNAPIDEDEYQALTEAKQNQVWRILHLGTLNPFGVEADLLISIFGAGSNTITALAAARKESISRAVELGLGTIAPGDVENARY